MSALAGGTEGRPVLDVQDLTVAYGKAEVVHGVSFEVRPSEIVLLLGRNGAGKTATLLGISGLIAKQGGRVVFGGLDITSASPRAIARAGLGQVLEGHRVFPDLSVEDNLSVAVLPGRVPVDRQRESTCAAWRNTWPSP